MKTSKRDKVVEAVSNWIINTFATAEYARVLKLVNVLGMKELDRIMKKTKSKP